MAVVLLSMAKDANDDIKRHKSDDTINKRTTERLVRGKWISCEWNVLQLGDTVRIKGDHHIPADVVILSTSGGDGECFVETMDLDGETNLKRRACR